MRLVVIESPYAGDVARNMQYLRRCMADAFERGEAPFASHGLYTWVLDDGIPTQREQGIAAGLEWAHVADVHAFYVDLGISSGMLYALEAALHGTAAIEIRRIGAEP